MGMDVSGRNPSTEEGYYFRANCWSWRPIHALCEITKHTHKLKFDTKGWDVNDGKGLRNQNQCDKLADALEDILKHHFHKITDENQEIEFNLGCWVNMDNSFVTQNMNSRISSQVDEKYPYGTFITEPIVLDNGMRVKSAYTTSISFMKEWITFLRGCGGFQIF